MNLAETVIEMRSDVLLVHLCNNCHLSVNPFMLGDSPLHPYPSQLKTVALVTRFSHKLHLSPDTNFPNESQLNCQSCHTPLADGIFIQFPNHSHCHNCHAKRVTPSMTDCSGCHRADGPSHHRKFLCNDIRFSHIKHQKHLSGKPTNCSMCHSSILKSVDSVELNLPSMSTCATCHDREESTPEQMRIENCGLCHQDTVDATVLPSSHTGESQIERIKARCR